MGSDNNNEAFHTEPVGAEDEDALDRAGFDDQLIKKGEDWCIEEEADTATLMEGDAPRSKAQPVSHRPHHVQHTHVIMDTPAAPGAPDEEEGCLPTVPPHRKHDTPKLGRTLLE